MRTFGGMLLEFRRAAGLTQEELAEAAGLSARSIRDLERGRRERPQRRTMELLVSALGLADSEAALLLGAGRIGRPEELPADDATAGTGLLDRSSQLAVLERAAGEARTGRGAVVLIRSGAGMGKTSLVNAWAGLEQRRGMRVLRASGGELEQDFAFSVLRQLVEPLLAGAGQAGRERLLAGPAELASYALRVEGGGDAAGLAPEASLGVLHSLYWLLVHATDDGPIALAVDDAHWADGPSVRWLEYLARRLRGLPLLLVLAARPDSGTTAEPLLEQITAQPDCRQVGLPALTATSVARLVRTALGQDAEPRFVAACVEAAQGNPLLLRELLRALADDGVDPVADQAHLLEESRGRILAVGVVKRLARQPEAARRLARALVVLGDRASWHLVAELAGLGEAEAREHGRQLRRIGVLAPGTLPRFDHPLVRAAIAEAVAGPVELAAGHARAAELLRGEGAAGEQVATHLLLAEPSGEAWRVEVLREAARVTRGRGAPEITLTYLRRALREPMSGEQRAPLLLELGADEMQGDLVVAAHHLTQALSALPDPYSRAHAAYLLANALFIGHQHARAVDVLARAVEDLRQAGDDGLARELSWYLQAQMLMMGYEDLSTLPAARRLAGELWEQKLAGSTPGQCAVLVALSAWAVTGGASAAVTNDLLDRALRGGITTGDQTGLLVSLAGMGFVTTDRLDDAAARFDRTADIGVRYGSPRMVSAAMMWQLTIRARRGQQLGLTPDIECPGIPAREDLETRVRMAMTTLVGESLIERCDLNAAAGIQVPDADTDQVGWLWQGPLLLVRGRLHAERGNRSAALGILLDYGAREKQAQVTNLAMVPWRSQAASLHLALGQRREALQLASEEMELAHTWGTARAIGIASRCLGVATGGREGVALLRESVAVLERSPARLELARARYELGAALLRTDEVDRARRTLADALDLAETCGSVLLAGQVRRALTAVGVRPRPAPPVAPSMSMTEHRLLEMVGAGHSDRQIAQALLLTPQQVTGLMDLVGRTLGVSSRAEMAEHTHPAGAGGLRPARSPERADRSGAAAPTETHSYVADQNTTGSR